MSVIGVTSLYQGFTYTAVPRRYTVLSPQCTYGGGVGTNLRRCGGLKIIHMKDVFKTVIVCRIYTTENGCCARAPILSRLKNGILNQSHFRSGFGLS